MVPPLVGWIAPVAIADAPLALLAVAGLLLGVFFMSRGPRGEVAAPPAGDAPSAAPAGDAPSAPPVGDAPPAAASPEPGEPPPTAFRMGQIRLAGEVPAEPESEPAATAPGPPPVPSTTFRQGTIRLGGRGQSGDEPPG